MNVTTSPHFTLQPLTNGVYAALHKENGWAIGNAGIVDLGQETLVFDSSMTPAAGADLRSAAEALFNRPVRYLINSHYHNDHVWGNQAFDMNTTIIADVRTRDLFATAGQAEVDHFSSIAADRHADLNAAYDAAPDDSARDAIAPWRTYFAALAATMPILTVRRPDLSFEDRLTLHGSARRAQLINHVGGHTPSDTVLYLPDDALLFAADLLFVDTHPYLGDGDPDALLTVTAVLEALETAAVVPGHGPVGTGADFHAQRDYITVCGDAAAALLAAQKTPAQLDATALPARFRGWMLERFFAANVAFFYSRLREAT